MAERVLEINIKIVYFTASQHFHYLHKFPCSFQVLIKCIQGND